VTPQPEPLTPSLPPENTTRGVLLALVALPVGVLVWLLLWSVGFVASIVAIGIALAALFLYRRGSGGRIGTLGAATVTAITVVGIVAAFVGGSLLHAADTAPIPTGDLVVSIVFAVVFGGLGCFIAWRTAIVQAKNDEPSTTKPLPGFEDGPGTDRW
jgi:hypothetical protein